MPVKRESPFIEPLLERKVYSEAEVKRVRIGSREFHVPVKRIRGESEGKDHLLILGVLENEKLRMPSSALHAQLIKEVKKQFNEDVDESRIHVLGKTDRITYEFVKKAFSPIHEDKYLGEVMKVTKNVFLRQFNDLAKKDSFIKRSKYAKQFLRSLVGVHENDSLSVNEIQDFYRLLLRERLDRIKQAIPPKRLLGRKPVKGLLAEGETVKGLLTGRKPARGLLSRRKLPKGLLTEGEKESLVRFERLSIKNKTGETSSEDSSKKPGSSNDKKDKVDQKSSETENPKTKVKYDLLESSDKDGVLVKAESESKNQGVNVSVNSGAGGFGGFGMYPNMWRNNEEKKEEKKKEDSALKPRPVNYIAFAALIIIILIIMGILFS